MSYIKRIVSLFMVSLMLITAVPFTAVKAAEDTTEEYTVVAEETLSDSSLAESSAEGGRIFFGNTEFDGCYGNQLSGVAKELYDLMVKKYATDKKTGEYTYTFKAPFTFNAENLDKIIVDNDEYNEIKTEISCTTQAAMDAFLYDHPEVFWFKSLKTSYDISIEVNSNGYKCSVSSITITPSEIYDGASAKISEFDSAVNSALASITVTESRYDTLKSIHDYICNRAWYNLVSEKKVHSAEPIFIGNGGVVCEGYSKSFKILCDRLDIPCALISGYAGENHMWNYVQMDDGRWYLVDATWDDQDDMIYDTYFLSYTDTVGFKGVAISQERTENNDFSGVGMFTFTYPALSTVAYGAHTHEWESEFTVDKAPTCTEKGSKSIHCKSCDETRSVTEIAYLGHSWNEGVTDFVSTCKTHGIKTYTCLTDSKHQYTEQLKLDPSNHEGGTYIKGASEPTCKSTGYTGNIFCKGCDTRLSLGRIIPVKPHTFTVYVSDGNATCISDGTKTAVCDMCKKAVDTVADAGSKNDAMHKYSVRAVCEPTCTDSGDRTYVCDVCETAAYMEIIPPTGHRGGTATCKSPAKCDVCEAEYGSVNKNNHKSSEILKAVASTCTKTGLTEGKKCKDCGKITVPQKTVAKKAHINKTTTVKATLSKNGKTETKCTVCGVSQKTVIYAPKYFKLSASSYICNGKTKTPEVTVKDSKGKVLKKGTDYTVSYSKSRKKPGKYTVTVTLKGNYSGTKKLTFEILPAKATLSKVTAASKSFTAAWKTVSGATGYEVQYSTSKKFTKKNTKTVTLKKSKTKKATVRKLTKGKKYYVRVRAYKTVSGKKLYGSWSVIKSVKIK